MDTTTQDWILCGLMLLGFALSGASMIFGMLLSLTKTDLRSLQSQHERLQRELNTLRQEMHRTRV